MKFQLLALKVLSVAMITSCACSKGGSSGSGPVVPVTPPVKGIPVDYWITKGDQSALLESHPAGISFTSATNTNMDITVDSTQVFQTVDGFGYTLTSGSAQLINKLDGSTRTSLLQELFGAGTTALVRIQ